MVFDHIVKHNGIRYAAGENVPIENNKHTQKIKRSPVTFTENVDVEETEIKKRGRQTVKRD